MGQTIADRRRKFFSNEDASVRAKQRKKLDARRRHREAHEFKTAARRAAFALSVAV